MATLPERSPSSSPRAQVPAERNDSALLAFLCEYTIKVGLPTAAPKSGDRSDPTSQHALETQRLVALLTKHLSSPVAPRTAEPEPPALTRREVEVLDALADGSSTAEIATRLHISVNTARNHVQRILEKLGVHSRLQAVNAGMRHGLLHRRAG